MKRVQKSVPHQIPPSRPSEPTPSAGLRNEPLSTTSSRRRQSSFRDQSFRDQRASHIQNDSQNSPSKRYGQNSRPPAFSNAHICLVRPITRMNKWLNDRPPQTHRSFTTDNIRSMERGEAMRRPHPLGSPTRPIHPGLSIFCLLSILMTSTPAWLAMAH